MKKLIGLLALIALVSGGEALRAQGIIAPGHVMGNGTESPRTATDAPLFSVLDQNFSGIGLLTRTGTGAYSILSGATAGRLLVDQGAGSLPAFVVLSGDGTLAANGTFNLAPSGVTAGTYGDGTHSTQVTFDAKGRATSASSVAITHASGDLAAANNLSDLANASAARTNLGTAPGTGLSTDGEHLNLQPAQNGTIGGVEAIPSASHQWIAYIDTSGIPHQTLPSFADISGTNGVASGGTGNTSLTTNVIYKGAGTSPMVASSCSDTGFVFQCSEPTSLGGNALLQGFTTGSAASTGQLLVLDASGDVEPATTATTDGFVGIAHANAASSGLTLNVAIAGEHVCLFDGPTTAKDWVVFSSTIAGDCHDTGSATRATGQYQIGQVLSTNASAGSYTINIENQYTPAGGSGSGDLTGPPSSVAGDIPSFSDATGKVLGDSGVSYNAIPAANLAYTAPGTGAGTRSQAARNADYIDAFDYMTAAQATAIAARTYATDISSALNNAVAACTAAGGGIVYLPAGLYPVSSAVNLVTGCVLKGAGMGATDIKVLAGVSTVVLKTTNFDSLVNTNTIGGPYQFGVEDMTLDGNGPNVTTPQNIVDIYGYNYTVENVQILNNYNNGFFSQWANGATVPISSGGNSMESYIRNLRIQFGGGTVGATYGLVYEGPSDSVLDFVTIANQYGTTQSCALIKTSASGTQYNANGTDLRHFHCYGAELIGLEIGAGLIYGDTIENEFVTGNGLQIDSGGYMVATNVCSWNDNNGLDISGSNSQISNYCAYSNGNGVVLESGATTNVLTNGRLYNNTSNGIAALTGSVSNNIIGATGSGNGVNYTIGGTTNHITADF